MQPCRVESITVQQGSVAAGQPLGCSSTPLPFLPSPDNTLSIPIWLHSNSSAVRRVWRLESLEDKDWFLVARGPHILECRWVLISDVFNSLG